MTIASSATLSHDWSTSPALSRARVAAILTATVLLAVLDYYFIGVDKE